MYCTTAEEISKPRTHTDSLAQAVSIQHPTQAQPCATQAHRVGSCEGGSRSAAQQCLMCRGG